MTVEADRYRQLQSDAKIVTGVVLHNPSVKERLDEGRQRILVEYGCVAIDFFRNPTKNSLRVLSYTIEQAANAGIAETGIDVAISCINKYQEKGGVLVEAKK